MKNLTRLFISLFLFIFLSANADDYVSPFCPVFKELNTATKFHYKRAIDNLITSADYSENLSHLGISIPVAFDDLRILETETDSAVCQKFNERFSKLNVDYIYDHEMNKYVTSWFVIYYEVNDRYLVVRHPYSPGSSSGETGPPVMADVPLYVFDKKILTILVCFPFEMRRMRKVSTD